ncbi:MAG: hypothetical protein KME42_14125 [Tildeniella nuda ZEHNDER 1965/U140]|jgi:hypothetical protein|nr:hypothetical protein [Tildeniella nuda ZEHNDER 1965/U140]
MDKSAIYKGFRISYSNERDLANAKTDIDLYFENIEGGYPRVATNLLRTETYKGIDVRVMERYKGLNPIEYQCIFSGEKLPLAKAGNVMYVSTNNNETVAIENAKSAIDKAMATATKIVDSND